MSQKNRRPRSTTARRLNLGALVLAAAFVAFSTACSGRTSSTDSASTADVWGTNSVTPAVLVSELATPTKTDKPVVVCTGPPMLYRSGHVPGAVFHGPASSPEGIKDLTAWASTLPRAANVVIYCGCCPMDVCPNLRPAYKALKDLGFAKVRVLLLPSNFGTDWAEAGHPIEK